MLKTNYFWQIPNIRYRAITNFLYYKQKGPVFSIVYGGLVMLAQNTVLHILCVNLACMLFSFLPIFWTDICLLFYPTYFLKLSYHGYVLSPWEQYSPFEKKSVEYNIFCNCNYKYH